MPVTTYRISQRISAGRLPEISRAFARSRSELPAQGPFKQRVLLKMSIKKILVANRSEIAIRVFRAANELGLKTVAVFAEEDKLALHRFKADEAYLIGKGKGPVEAYLQIEEYIRIARISGAD